MALIKCPECGKEISDKATACPNCGYPITVMDFSEITEDSEEKQEKKEVPIEEQFKEVISREEAVDEASHEEGPKDEIQKPVAEEISEVETSGAVKSKKPFVIGAIAIALLGVAVFFGTANLRAYSAAMKLFDSGEYQQAAVQFQHIGDYKDSSDMVKECSYQIATDLEENGKVGEAILEYEKVPGYKDSDDKVLQLKYKQAGTLVENEDFEGALKLYKELGEYQDSKEKAEKCEYELTVDGQFYRTFKKGLMKRWDLANKGSGLKECALAELGEIESFYDQEFLDKELQDWVVQYIDSIRAQLEAVKYESVDYNTYAEKSNESYSTRAMLLKKFFEEHEMEFDEKYNDSVDLLTGAGEAAEEQKALKDTIEKMMGDFVVSMTSNEYGWKDYSTHMKNETEYTFEYFYVDISAIDENGKIVTTGQASLNTKWSPGQEADAPTWFEDNNFEIEGHTFEFQPHYSTGTFYE